jgi:large subunit ribosomal protein L24
MSRQWNNKWIRKGDEVIVLTGNDKGRVGKVIARSKELVLVEGVNVRKKAVRKSEQNPKGGFVDSERPIHLSNVKLHVGGKGIRLKVRTNKKGEKELFYTQQGKEKVHRVVKIGK